MKQAYQILTTTMFTLAMLLVVTTTSAPPVLAQTNTTTTTLTPEERFQQLKEAYMQPGLYGSQSEESSSVTNSTELEVERQHELRLQQLLQEKGMQDQRQQQQQPGLTSSAPPTTTTTTTTDPELQKFDQIANDCKATIQRMYPGAQTAEDVFMVQPTQTTTSADFEKMKSCNQLLNQAIVQYCNNLQTYDATRCAYVDTPQTDLLLDMTAIIAESDFLFSPDQFGSLLAGR